MEFGITARDRDLFLKTQREVSRNGKCFHWQSILAPQQALASTAAESMFVAGAPTQLKEIELGGFCLETWYPSAYPQVAMHACSVFHSCEDTYR